MISLALLHYKTEENVLRETDSILKIKGIGEKSTAKISKIRYLYGR